MAAPSPSPHGLQLPQCPAPHQRHHVAGFQKFPPNYLQQTRSSSSPRKDNVAHPRPRRQRPPRGWGASARPRRPRPRRARPRRRCRRGPGEGRPPWPWARWGLREAGRGSQGGGGGGVRGGVRQGLAELKLLIMVVNSLPRFPSRTVSNSAPPNGTELPLHNHLV